MNTQTTIPSIDPEISANAVSVYGGTDAMDDFPVLKAFQQYVDAEQAKARKRLLTISIFFGVLMLIVIGVFVALLIKASAQNQSLNDRLVEYAMNDRNRPNPTQDPSVVEKFTAKIEDLQKKLFESQEKAMKATLEAEARIQKIQAEAAARKPESTAADVEIARLKALLDVEKQKLAAERERQRQAELEAYRRQHYPQYYEQQPNRPEPPKRSQPVKRSEPSKRQTDKDDARELAELIKMVDEDAAISYFDEDEKKGKSYSIPVDVKGSSAKENSTWRIPADE